MLHELIDYAAREGIKSDPGFKPKRVRWLLVFDTNGGHLKRNWIFRIKSSCVPRRFALKTWWAIRSPMRPFSTEKFANEEPFHSINRYAKRLKRRLMLCMN